MVIPVYVHIDVSVCKCVYATRGGNGEYRKRRFTYDVQIYNSIYDTLVGKWYFRQEMVILKKSESENGDSDLYIYQYVHRYATLEAGKGGFHIW